jgi:hypothetical protein
MLKKVPLYESTWGRGGITPPFFASTLDGRDELHALEKEPLVYTVYEARWVQEPVWTLPRRKLSPAENRTLIPRCTTRSIVAILAQPQIAGT